MKITAVTTQKNEGAFLLEWIAYHKIIGFTDIVILSNDCEDGSDEMLDHLSKSGEIIHLRNDGPYDDRGIQFAALKLADRQKAVKEADWIMHLDIDEFLNIHVGEWSNWRSDRRPARCRCNRPDMADVWQQRDHRIQRSPDHRSIRTRRSKNHALAMARIHDQNAVS